MNIIKTLESKFVKNFNLFHERAVTSHKVQRMVCEFLNSHRLLPTITNMSPGLRHTYRQMLHPSRTYFEEKFSHHFMHKSSVCVLPR